MTSDMPQVMRAVHDKVLPQILALCEQYGSQPLFAVLVVTLEGLTEGETTREQVMDAVDAYFPPVLKLKTQWRPRLVSSTPLPGV